MGRGFTLLEVLVALVIIGTALAASLRSVASLTQNSQDLRAAMMATWSAENRLTQMRLSQEWPPLIRLRSGRAAVALRGADQSHAQSRLPAC